VREAALRVMSRLEQDLLASFAAVHDEPRRKGTRARDRDHASTILERAFDVLANQKYARTLAWLYLSHDSSGDAFGHGDQIVRVARAVHDIRRSRRTTPPPFEDTLFIVALASFALFGHAAAAETLRKTAGLDDKAFLRWFTQLLIERLER
jgi:hypothetical protein